MTKLYVGNLPYSVTFDGLKEMFANYGEVVSATIISDKFSGRSKGDSGSRRRDLQGVAEIETGELHRPPERHLSVLDRC